MCSVHSECALHSVQLQYGFFSSDVSALVYQVQSTQDAQNLNHGKIGSMAMSLTLQEAAVKDWLQ